MKYAIYGTGKWGSIIFKRLEELKLELKWVFDSDKQKWGELFYTYRITSSEEIDFLDDCIIIVAVHDQGYEIIEQLVKNGGKRENIWSLGQALACLWKVENEKQTASLNNVSSIIFDCCYGLVLGGIEAWTKETVCKLREKNKNVFIITPHGRYSLNSALQNGILYFDSGCDLYSERALNNIYKLLEKQLPCIVLVNNVTPVMLAAISLKKIYPDAIKIVSVIHGGKESLYKKNVEYVNVVDLYLATSTAIMKGMCTTEVPREKIRQIVFPIRAEEQLRRNYSVDKENAIKIGYAGRIEVYPKRLDLLPELTKELERLNVKYQISIAGTGTYLENIKRFVEENNLDGKINILYEIDRSEINHFWEEMDISINLSDYEGVCISNSEAMACGAVPIITNTSAREYIKDGENGYLVPIGDYRQMAEKIKYLDEHRERLAAMGEKAHRAIVKNCSEKKSEETWNVIFKKLGFNDLILR